ncbi:uncharacterized protein IL334_001626 [Kwoniella shivajii]|uniref:Uncharacterized protein n=1 Tax=Kwoniella shivajii TaxID=564305 RepID=A0ABZ1CWM9_9TREE|nr:hypothetical protein IL334_001626 [Kwoniella shivajii]
MNSLLSKYCLGPTRPYDVSPMESPRASVTDTPADWSTSGDTNPMSTTILGGSGSFTRLTRPTLKIATTYTLGSASSLRSSSLPNTIHGLRMESIYVPQSYNSIHNPWADPTVQMVQSSRPIVETTEVARGRAASIYSVDSELDTTFFGPSEKDTSTDNTAWKLQPDDCQGSSSHGGFQDVKAYASNLFSSLTSALSTRSRDWSSSIAETIRTITSDSRLDYEETASDPFMWETLPEDNDAQDALSSRLFDTEHRPPSGHLSNDFLQFPRRKPVANPVDELYDTENPPPHSTTMSGSNMMSGRLATEPWTG